MRWCSRANCSTTMKSSTWSSLVGSYRDALSTYAASGEEQHLQAAYELGRSALNAGCGVLDMVRLHQEALLTLVASTAAPVATVRLAKRHGALALADLCGGGADPTLLAADLIAGRLPAGYSAAGA